MIKLIDILKEAKQVGDIYHFTYSKYLKNIKSKGLKFNPDNSDLEIYKNKYYISTTREKNPDWIYSDEYNIRITLDGDRISNHYKVTPINVDNIWGTYKGHNPEESDDYGTTKIGEAFETRIISNTPGYLSPMYFKKIEKLEDY
jgi:hypothetical protein